MSDCPIVRGLKGTRVTVLMDGTTKIRPQLVEDAVGLIERLRAELAAERERVEKLSQENAALRCDAAGGRERVAKLREALEPLKASADRADSDDLADTDATYVVVAHLRHARAVLEETGA